MNHPVSVVFKLAQVELHLLVHKLVDELAHLHHDLLRDLADSIFRGECDTRSHLRLRVLTRTVQDRISAMSP